MLQEAIGCSHSNVNFYFLQKTKMQSIDQSIVGSNFQGKKRPFNRLSHIINQLTLPKFPISLGNGKQAIDCTIGSIDYTFRNLKICHLKVEASIRKILEGFR